MLSVVVKNFVINFIGEDNEIMLISTEGIVIRLYCKDISQLSRVTSGVKLINMDTENNIHVASVAKVRDSDPEADIRNLESQLAEEQDVGTVEEAVDDIPEEADENPTEE